MDTRALRYFQVVAEYGSYSRGAEWLRISQPAVSRQIRALEDELGRKLFRRHGHGVTLTEAGRILLDRTQSAFRTLEQARSEIRGATAGPSGAVTLAVPPAAGRWLMPPLAERMARELPGVQLRVLGGFSGTIEDWLVRGRVDLALAHDPLPRKGFRIVPLAREEVCLVGLPDAPALARGFATPAAVAKLPLILPGRPNASRRLLDAWLAEEGGAPPARLEVDDHSVIRALLRAGAGFALLTRGGFAREAQRGELAGVPFRPRVQWTLALVGAAEPGEPEVVEPVAALLRRVVKEAVRAGWPARALDGAARS
ncbi:LysR family transcriptional regulator [Roseomonas sp. AR75]|uniref:LysR family transcriptional regulator n=1 Tax=Roseomonas sp. AR75 TaxID=2562311 RepID=UPI0010C0E334|nr:LysR family transcriptional regulator [Roseomonas sp. AR75]